MLLYSKKIFLVPLYMPTEKKNTSPSRAKKSRSKKYEEPLKVNGSFMDVIKASVKDAKSKDKKKP